MAPGPPTDLRADVGRPHRHHRAAGLGSARRITGGSCDHRATASKRAPLEGGSWEDRGRQHRQLQQAHGYIVTVTAPFEGRFRVRAINSDRHRRCVQRGPSRKHPRHRRPRHHRRRTGRADAHGVDLSGIEDANGLSGGEFPLRVVSCRRPAERGEYALALGSTLELEAGDLGKGVLVRVGFFDDDGYARGAHKRPGPRPRGHAAGDLPRVQRARRARAGLDRDGDGGGR